MGVVVLGEELVLELRHVDVARALATAGFALEAKVEDLVQAVAAEVLLGGPSRDDGA